MEKSFEIYKGFFKQNLPSKKENKSQNQLPLPEKEVQKEKTLKPNVSISSHKYKEIQIKRLASLKTKVFIRQQTLE